MTNLGYSNAWGGEIPPVVEACRELKHKITVTYPDGCYKPRSKYVCKKCDYVYRIDSGG